MSYEEHRRRFEQRSVKRIVDLGLVQRSRHADLPARLEIPKPMRRDRRGELVVAGLLIGLAMALRACVTTS